MRMMAGFFGLLLAAACTQPAPAAPEKLQESRIAQYQAALSSTSADECTRHGGDWRPVCLRGKPACVVTFADAGKACTDKSDCSGLCIANGQVQPEAAATGACSRTSDPCGCRQTVTRGKADYMLCVD